VKRKSLLCCCCQFMLVMLQVPTYTSEDAQLLLPIRKDRDTLETSLCKCRMVKTVRDMNEVEYDHAKYTNPYVSGLCISILHFI
jgi:hypothetical protein